MIATITSYALDGLQGYPVDIEVDTQKGIASFDVVGLASGAVKESRNRVRAAIRNSFFDFTARRTTVNLAPADVKKQGSSFDFPIAIGFLLSTDQISGERVKDFVMIGELSLDGSLRHVNGVLPLLISAVQNGYRKFIVPFANAEEAAYVQNAEVYAAKNLSEACAFLGGMKEIPPVKHKIYTAKTAGDKYGVDLKYVKGQSQAKRALEIAVAGGHNFIMCGPAGAGKTMLAKCIPTIMPDMSFEEALETTKIHSVAGILDPKEGMVTVRPFRTPHHTATMHSLIGGGQKSTCGEVSLAHNGVLFLDEMPEYDKRTLETLRQPLEDGVVTVTRVARTIEYPARFMLVAGMNPCPCGNYGSDDPERVCTCTDRDRKRYIGRISGPLMDRIDIFVNVDTVKYDELRSEGYAESSEEVRKRVSAARAIQRDRYSGEGIHTNAEMQNAQMDKYCKLDDKSEALLKYAFHSNKLSARGVGRILKVARTIADLDGRESICLSDLAEAIQYKTTDLTKNA